ncbi:hypothetical protein Tco_1248561 [Tanacetum coccineum]
MLVRLHRFHLKPIALHDTLNVNHDMYMNETVIKTGEEMPDETPRKRSRTEREDVNMEDANNGGNYEATNHGKETSTSSSDDLIIIT